MLRNQTLNVTIPERNIWCVDGCESVQVYCRWDTGPCTGVETVFTKVGESY